MYIRVRVKGTTITKLKIICITTGLTKIKQISNAINCSMFWACFSYYGKRNYTKLSNCKLKINENNKKKKKTNLIT